MKTPLLLLLLALAAVVVQCQDDGHTDAEAAKWYVFTSRLRRDATVAISDFRIRFQPNLLHFVL